MAQGSATVAFLMFLLLKMFYLGLFIGQLSRVCNMTIHVYCTHYGLLWSPILVSYFQYNAGELLLTLLFSQK
jgi:K+-transporting ATPase A subunit